MLYTQDRDKLRKMWIDVWKKAQNNKQLDAMETLIARVIEAHPEYHVTLNNAKLGTEYLEQAGEANPFLHMAMHLSIQEQAVTNRPEGIKDIYIKLSEKTKDFQQTEHMIMDCLSESLWQSKQQQKPADEFSYMQCLNNLLQI